MTKTYTITANDTTITYTVRTCTAVAVSIGETERTIALYVESFAASGEHVEYVVFNATMPEDEDEFMALCDYPNEWDSYYGTIATVCFADGVNIDDRVNAAAKRIRKTRSLSKCDDAVVTICERAGMLSDLEETASELEETAEERIVLLKAANLLGVDINGPWSADPATIELAKAIRDAHDWESCKDECRQLCDMAGMADEWDNSDGETFEGVLDRAAEKLHVRIW